MRAQRFLASRSLLVSQPTLGRKLFAPVRPFALRNLCLIRRAEVAPNRPFSQSRFIFAESTEFLSVTGNRGSYKIAVPLPTKGVQVFSLPSDREQMRAFFADVLLEDPSISKIAAYDSTGARIAGSTHGKDLLGTDWKLSINNKGYMVKAPIRTATGIVIEGVQESKAYQDILDWLSEQNKTKDSISVNEFIAKAQDIGVSQQLAKQFLTALNNQGHILHFSDNIELSEKIFLNSTSLAIMKKVEERLDLPHIQMTQSDRFALLQKLKVQLQPLEDARQRLLEKADKNVQRMVWTLFGAIGFQFILFARLTWWESSWDVMEPVTYFTTAIETAIAGYFWFLFTGKEYEHMGLREILFQWRFQKLAVKYNFDTVKYDKLKKEIADIEHEIKMFADDATLKR